MSIVFNHLHPLSEHVAADEGDDDDDAEADDLHVGGGVSSRGRQRKLKHRDGESVSSYHSFLRLELALTHETV